VDIQQAYTDWSVTYDSDRNLTRDLDQQVTLQLLGNLRCKSILEIGCGTGKNTELLARVGDHVHAVDFSSGMIDKAKAKLLAANVTFETLDLTQPWPLKDQAFDLIACNLVLEHIENLSPIFAEAFRVLMARGRFLVCELHPFRQYQGTQARFRKDLDESKIPAFVHHISDFTNSAVKYGFSVVDLREWWHEEDQRKPPRLVSFMFEKSPAG
jgi:ubiquinone/menaquinone biosynthesis C-methylase UbiE